jgi:predicted lipoprotein with Yx(FWY)xxD motif
MTTLSPRFGRRLLAAAAALLTMGLVAGALQFSSSARADNGPQCSDPVTSAPAGPATVSTATAGDFGNVLVVGSGDYAGCSLYLLTSDQLHRLAGSNFACGEAPNAIPGSPACDTVLWPALLTDGAPIAGAGVDPKLLGTVTRTDLPGLPAVQQVTYAGQPLYRFFLDEGAGETEGANLFDPVTSPTGIWYLVDPARGAPATGPAVLQLETAPVGGTGSDATVLAATMDQDFSLTNGAFPFPVYTLSADHGHADGPGPMGHGGPCDALCAQYWPPVLTSGRPQAGTGVDQHALGTVMRPDGTQQVTYRGRPLYLSVNDAVIPPLPYNGAAEGINGAGADTIWGVFDTIPPLH